MLPNINYKINAKAPSSNKIHFFIPLFKEKYVTHIFVAKIHISAQIYT